MNKKWSEEEKKYLIENFNHLNNDELSKKLGRTINSIRVKASRIKSHKNSILRGYWTKEEENYLIENFYDMRNKDISKIINRSEHGISKKASILKLRKNPFYKNKAITIKNKTLGRDLSIENIKEIARKYKTRGEFLVKDPSAYSTARINFGLDNVCDHMFKQNYSTPQLLLFEILKILSNGIDIKYNDRMIIKPYELDIFIPEYNLAFEYNGIAWHKDNKKDLIKKNICKENDIELLILVENNRNYVADIKKQLINNLDILNKKLNLNLEDKDINDIDENNLYELVKGKILDVNDVKKIISKYTYYSDFIKKEKSIYSKLKDKKLLNLFTKDLIKVSEKWNMNRIKNVVEKYNDYSDFLKNEYGCYIHIKKNKLEYLLSDLKRNKRVWNFDEIKKISVENGYNTLYKLGKYYPGAKRYLKTNNLILEYRIFIKENVRK